MLLEFLTIILCLLNYTTADVDTIRPAPRKRSKVPGANNATIQCGCNSEPLQTANNVTFYLQNELNGTIYLTLNSPAMRRANSEYNVHIQLVHTNNFNYQTALNIVCFTRLDSHALYSFEGITNYQIKCSAYNKKTNATLKRDININLKHFSDYLNNPTLLTMSLQSKYLIFVLYEYLGNQLIYNEFDDNDRIKLNCSVSRRTIEQNICHILEERLPCKRWAALSFNGTIKYILEGNEMTTSKEFQLTSADDVTTIICSLHYVNVPYFSSITNKMYMEHIHVLLRKRVSNETTTDSSNGGANIFLYGTGVIAGCSAGIIAVVLAVLGAFYWMKKGKSHDAPQSISKSSLQSSTIISSEPKTIDRSDSLVYDYTYTWRKTCLCQICPIHKVMENSTMAPRVNKTSTTTEHLL